MHVPIYPWRPVRHNGIFLFSAIYRISPVAAAKLMFLVTCRSAETWTVAESRSALVFSVEYLFLLCLPCRASFSVQVRDFVDLVVTRLSDLNGRDEAQRRREGGEGRQRTRGAEASCTRDSSLPGRDCGDPTTREVIKSLALCQSITYLLFGENVLRAQKKLSRRVVRFLWCRESQARPCAQKSAVRFSRSNTSSSDMRV